MALTGKTIGELLYLQFPTNDTLLPVEYDGGTYHITFSSITYNEGTYSQFVTDAGNGILTPGRFYLMTDYQTCYDQPNYNNIKQPIYTDNYMTGSTEPILLLAMSTTQFSPTVYSTLYPQDKITYDITWNTTEVSAGLAKGRITERIDNFNNRTDYDHRSILFKRYIGYSYNENQPLPGFVGISGLTGTTAVLYGNTGTTFNSNFSVGTFISIPSLNPYLFEIISVEDDFKAIISGETITTENNGVPYYFAYDDGIMSYYQPNVRQNQVFEYTTFGDAIDNQAAINNYVGNYSNLYFWNEYPFILANNVFISGSYINNTIGNDSYNNTFNDDCDSNQIGDSFYNNSTNDDFDGNIIGDYFNNNYITANFNNNRIGSDFRNNILTGGSFYRNNIGNNFEYNIWTNNDFQNNEIGNQYNNNKIYSDFYNNDIGNGYNNNKTYSYYYRNLIGNGYNNNTIYSYFHSNNIEHVFENNTIGDNGNIGGSDFTGNKIGNNFNNNEFKYNFLSNDILNDFTNNTSYWLFNKNSILNGFEGNTIGSINNLGSTFESNQIMNIFKGNNIQGNFTNNQIKTNFKANEIYNEFSYNNVGYNFFVNILSGNTSNNNMGNNFQFNTCYGSFLYNTVGVNFYSNQVKDGFGFGYGSYQGNKIGNNFYDNNIGEYFYNNTIPDNFLNNNIGNYFQWNIINTNVDNTDFTTNYGNIITFYYTSTGTGMTDNTYSSVGGATNGDGLNGTFNIVVSGGSVTNVTLSNDGTLYLCGDTITILGTSIGGVTGVVNTFSSNGIGLSGTTGSYPNIFANGGPGTGEGVTFDVTVIDGIVDSVVLNQGGGSYSVGNILTIPGNVFGSVDDITITVDSVYSDDFIIHVYQISPTPSVYDLYTCNIFKNSNLTNRLSYYDGNDVLTIKEINE